MKSIKKISLMLAAVFTFGSVAMANDVRQERKGMDPKVRAEKMTERMVKEYNLNDTQKSQLLEVNQALVEKIGNRPGGLNRHGQKGKPGPMAKGKKENKENKEGVAKENREKKDRDQARAERGERRHRADAPKISAEDCEKLVQERKQVHDNYNAQLQKIMNTEQYQAYAKKQTEREQKRLERGEKVKENRSKKSVSEKNSRKV